MHPSAQNIVIPQHSQQTLFSYDVASSVAPVKSKKVAIDFQGGSITSDAGVLLLRETESQLSIISRLSKCLHDTRRFSSVTHSINDLMTQRILQISCGYEDANDSNTLRQDPAMKLAVGRLPESDGDLASQPTISRLENQVSRTALYRMAKVFLDLFLASYQQPPEVIVLDFDDTNHTVYGQQQLALFNGYHQETCYQPLHVYEGLSGKMIATILRPGKRPNGKEIVAYLQRIVSHIRQQWPNTLIVYRGDSHYSAKEVFTFLAEQQHCFSVTGLTGNPVLLKRVESLIKTVRSQSAGYKRYTSFCYQATSWKYPRKVVAKVEITEKGLLNVRFISTEMMQAPSKLLYEKIYCARGNDELYIKEHKTYTKSDRTSCHRFLANQFRLFLHSAAYVLLHSLRANVLSGTSLAKATFESLRLKLFKVGARIIERKTKISVHLPTAYPYQGIFSQCLAIFAHLRAQPS